MHKRQVSNLYINFLKKLEFSIKMMYNYLVRCVLIYHMIKCICKIHHAIYLKPVFHDRPHFYNVMRMCSESGFKDKILN